MKVRIPSIVQREVREAAEYYEEEEPGLGDRFWQEFDALVRWIAATLSGPGFDPATFDG